MVQILTFISGKDEIYGENLIPKIRRESDDHSVSLAHKIAAYFPLFGAKDAKSNSKDEKNNSKNLKIEKIILNEAKEIIIIHPKENNNSRLIQQKMSTPQEGVVRGCQSKYAGRQEEENFLASPNIGPSNIASLPALGQSSLASCIKYSFGRVVNCFTLGFLTQSSLILLKYYRGGKITKGGRVPGNGTH